MRSDSHGRRAHCYPWPDSLLLAFLLAACDASGPRPVETSTGVRSLSEAVHVSDLGPSDAELTGVRSSAADAASLLVHAGSGATVGAHVLCTAAVSRRVAAFPGVVTDYALETLAHLGGDPAPSQLTLPGGRAEGLIVDVAATVPEPGSYYVAFFSRRVPGTLGTVALDRQGARLDPLHLQALLPAGVDGDVRMGERTFGLSEVRQLTLEVGQ